MSKMRLTTETTILHRPALDCEQAALPRVRNTHKTVVPGPIAREAPLRPAPRNTARPIRGRNCCDRGQRFIDDILRT